MTDKLGNCIVNLLISMMFEWEGGICRGEGPRNAYDNIIREGTGYHVLK